MIAEISPASVSPVVLDNGPPDTFQPEWHSLAPSFYCKQSTSKVDDVNPASRQNDVQVLKGVLPKLVVFQSKERLKQVGNAPNPRYTRRLSDLITTSFYEACRIGNFDAARHLMEALECEVLRSIRVAGVEDRYDGDDLAAVQTRYSLEVTKRALDQVESGLAATD